MQMARSPDQILFSPNDFLTQLGKKVMKLITLRSPKK